GVAARHRTLLQGDGTPGSWPRRRRGAPQLPQTGLLRRRADPEHAPRRTRQGLPSLRLRGPQGWRSSCHGPHAPRLRRPDYRQTRQDARGTAPLRTRRAV
ncbi:MAG: hypothetical protein AVDCRST_MAG58-3422, partial [uncultured Rubrobacteraceae bacterium]